MGTGRACGVKSSICGDQVIRKPEKARECQLAGEGGRNKQGSHI